MADIIKYALVFANIAPAQLTAPSASSSATAGAAVASFNTPPIHPALAGIRTFWCALTPRLHPAMPLDASRVSLLISHSPTFPLCRGLHLAGQSITDDLLTSVLCVTTNLQRLALLRCSRITNEAAQVIVDKAPQLRWLSFGWDHRDVSTGYGVTNALDDGTLDHAPGCYVQEIEEHRIEATREVAAATGKSIGVYYRYRYRPPNANAAWTAQQATLHAASAGTQIDEKAFAILLQHPNEELRCCACDWLRVVIEQTEADSTTQSNPFCESFFDVGVERLVELAASALQQSKLDRAVTYSLTLADIVAGCTSKFRWSITHNFGPTTQLQHLEQAAAAMPPIVSDIIFRLVHPLVGSVDYAHQLIVTRLTDALLRLGDRSFTFDYFLLGTANFDEKFVAALKQQQEQSSTPPATVAAIQSFLSTLATSGPATIRYILDLSVDLRGGSQSQRSAVQAVEILDHLVPIPNSSRLPFARRQDKAKAVRVFAENFSGVDLFRTAVRNATDEMVSWQGRNKDNSNPPTQQETNAVYTVFNRFMASLEALNTNAFTQTNQSGRSLFDELHRLVSFGFGNVSWNSSNNNSLLVISPYDDITFLASNTLAAACSMLGGRAIHVLRAIRDQLNNQQQALISTIQIGPAIHDLELFLGESRRSIVPLFTHMVRACRHLIELVAPTMATSRGRFHYGSAVPQRATRDEIPSRFRSAFTRLCTSVAEMLRNEMHLIVLRDHVKKQHEEQQKQQQPQQEQEQQGESTSKSDDDNNSNSSSSKKGKVSRLLTLIIFESPLMTTEKLNDNNEKSAAEQIEIVLIDFARNYKKIVDVDAPLTFLSSRLTRARVFSLEAASEVHSNEALQQQQQEQHQPLVRLSALASLSSRATAATLSAAANNGDESTSTSVHSTGGFGAKNAARTSRVKLKRFSDRYNLKDEVSCPFRLVVGHPRQRMLGFAFGLEDHLDNVVVPSVPQLADPIAALHRKREELQQLQDNNEERLCSLLKNNLEIERKFSAALARAELLRLSGVAHLEEEQQQQQLKRIRARIRAFSSSLDRITQSHDGNEEEGEQAAATAADDDGDDEFTRFHLFNVNNNRIPKFLGPNTAAAIFKHYQQQAAAAGNATQVKPGCELPKRDLVDWITNSRPPKISTEMEQKLYDLQHQVRADLKAMVACAELGVKWIEQQQQQEVDPVVGSWGGEHVGSWREEEADE